MICAGLVVAAGVAVHPQSASLSLNVCHAGSLQTAFTDIEKAFTAIRRLDMVGVLINDTPIFRVDHMPYGGNRRSGIGREGVRYAVEEMTNLRMVVINLT